MPVYQKDVCPICKSTDFKVLGRSDKGNVAINIPEEPYIVECRNCNLFYVNPMPHWTHEDFDVLYNNSYFIDKVQHDPKWLEIRANRNVASRFKRIEEHLSANSKTLLEVGSGIFAFMCVYLSKQGWNVTAQEPSPEICESLSHEHPGLKTVNAPFLELGSKEKYSLVYADSVFEHVPDPLEYIRKSADLLEEGGILYFISPNEYSFYNWLKTNLAKFKNGPVKYLAPYKEPYHLIGFSKKSMKIAAEETGLTLIRYIKKYDYFWFHALRKLKNPFIKYPVAFGLYLMDLIGWGYNLEIMFKKIRKK